jgi:hypothetical protein
VVLFRAPCEWDDGIPRSDAGVLTPRQAAGTIALLLGVEDSARRVEIQGVSKDAV